LIQQDIRRLQYGIIHKPHVDIVGVALGFFLELRHSTCLAYICEAVEQPTKFGVCGDVGLYKKDTFFGREPASKQLREKRQAPLSKFGRVLPNRDCVQIDDAVNAVVRVLHGDPIRNCADIIADCNRPRGLYA
jgi:hypothetical protein